MKLPTIVAEAQFNSPVFGRKRCFGKFGVWIFRQWVPGSTGEKNALLHFRNPSHPR